MCVKNWQRMRETGGTHKMKKVVVVVCVCVRQSLS